MELKSALGDFSLALTFPLKNRSFVHRLGGAVFLVLEMIVVVSVIRERDAEFKHEYVVSNLGAEIDNLEHGLLEFCALVAPAAVTHCGLVAILNGGDAFDWNKFAVNAGHEPAAAVLAKVFINGEKNGAGVVTRDDTAVFIGVNNRNAA